MKILHCCLSCFYIEGYAYQENLLPKYHRIMGNDVYVLASLQTFDKDGKLNVVDTPQKYINQDEIIVEQLPYRRPKSLFTLLRSYRGTYAALKKIAPDVIFMHGVQTLDSFVILKYVKKNKNVRLFIDNHADFSNSARSWTSKAILHKILWRFCAQRIKPYVTKFYGVLPARVDFLVNMYKLPKEKVELLVMGADDEFVKKSFNPEEIRETRANLGIGENEFLIVTGGKIDNAKKQTLLLMDAVNQLSSEAPVKLLIFGSIIPELKEALLRRCNDKVKYVGWLSSSETYRYLAPADLVVFPGRHSVLWEQTAGMGKPMIVKYWEGTTHIDKGGNVSFLYEDSVDELKVAISSAIKNIREMTEVAERNKNVFSYNDIARRSLQDDQIVG